MKNTPLKASVRKNCEGEWKITPQMLYTEFIISRLDLFPSFLHMWKTRHPMIRDWYLQAAIFSASCSKVLKKDMFFFSGSRSSSWENATSHSTHVLNAIPQYLSNLELSCIPPVSSKLYYTNLKLWSHLSCLPQSLADLVCTTSPTPQCMHNINNRSYLIHYNNRKYISLLLN